MVNVTVRDVPDDAHAMLVARAARTGQSLQEYLRRTLIETASRPTTDEWLRAMRSRVAEGPGSTLTADDVVRLIREDRDRG